MRSTPPVPCSAAAADPTAAGRHLPPQRGSHGDDGAPWAGVAGLHQPHSPTYTPIDPVLNVEVSPYKKVRKVVFVESIPKSPAGKVLKSLLKD